MELKHRQSTFTRQKMQNIFMKVGEGDQSKQREVQRCHLSARKAVKSSVNAASMAQKKKPSASENERDELGEEEETVLLGWNGAGGKQHHLWLFFSFSFFFLMVCVCYG